MTSRVSDLAANVEPRAARRSRAIARSRRTEAGYLWEMRSHLLIPVTTALLLVLFPPGEIGAFAAAAFDLSQRATMADAERLVASVTRDLPDIEGNKQ